MWRRFGDGDGEGGGGGDEYNMPVVPGEEDDLGGTGAMPLRHENGMDAVDATTGTDAHADASTVGNDGDTATGGTFAPKRGRTSRKRRSIAPETFPAMPALSVRGPRHLRAQQH